MKFLGPKVVDDVVRHDALGYHYEDNDGAVDGDGDDDDGNDSNGNDDQVVVGDDDDGQHLSSWRTPSPTEPP